MYVHSSQQSSLTSPALGERGRRKAVALQVGTPRESAKESEEPSRQGERYHQYRNRSAAEWSAA